MKIFSANFLVFLMLLMSLLIGPFAIAEEEEVVREQTWEQWFIRSNVATSRWFDSMADGLDLFLVGKRVTTRRNESFFRIENATVSSEGQSVLNHTSFVINPRLPNLEEYWHLKFTTYDEQEDQRNVKNEYLRQDARPKNYGASVGLFKKLGNVRVAFQPRVELQDPLRVSHSITLESVADSKAYLINPKLELYASADKGTGLAPALNFNFFISKIYNLTLINQGDYQDRLHLFTVTNGFSFGQILNEKSSLAYNVFFVTLNQPSYMLESYNISVAASQMVYKKILDFQIIPNIDFAYERSFKGVAGVTVVFNLNF